MKKNISTLILTFCLTVISLSVFAQGGSNQSKLVAFKINLDSTSIIQGDTIQLKAMQFYSEGHLPVNVTNYCNWVVSTPGIVSISQAGKLISVGYGEVSITAELGTGQGAIKSTPAKIEVEPKFTSFRIDAPNGTMIPLKGTVGFKFIGKDIYGMDVDLSKSVTWSCNKNFLKINSEGHATGKTEGICLIEAKYKGIVFPPLNVQVLSDRDIIGIENKDRYRLFSNTIGTGEAISLQALLVRDRDSIVSERIKWFSSSSEIATVDSEGKVTGQLEGQVYIYVLVDGYLSARYSVRVVRGIIGVKIPTVNQPILVGDSIQLIGLSQSNIDTWIYDPNENFRGGFYWKSLDTAIANVSQEGFVTGKSKGTAKIVFTERSYLLHKWFADTVEIQVYSVPNVYNITLHRDSIVNGGSKQLNAKAYTWSASGDKVNFPLNKNTVDWFSMNERIATVDDTGLVTAVGEGQAIIYYLYNGELSRDCLITVISKP